MERTIKFRGKNKSNEWIYFTNNYQELDSQNPAINTCSAMINLLGAYQKINEYDLIRNTFTEYTGIKDKNGKEIYEGDIIKILYTDWASQDDYKIGVVKYDIKDCSFKVSIYCEKYREYYFDSLVCGKFGWIEVIGNIFDNPNLLKEANNEKRN